MQNWKKIMMMMLLIFMGSPADDDDDDDDDDGGGGGDDKYSKIRNTRKTTNRIEKNTNRMKKKMKRHCVYDFFLGTQVEACAARSYRRRSMYIR